MLAFTRFAQECSRPLSAYIDPATIVAIEEQERPGPNRNWHRVLVLTLLSGQQLVVNADAVDSCQKVAEACSAAATQRRERVDSPEVCIQDAASLEERLMRTYEEGMRDFINKQEERIASLIAERHREDATA